MHNLLSHFFGTKKKIEHIFGHRETADKRLPFSADPPIPRSSARAIWTDGDVKPSLEEAASLPVIYISVTKKSANNEVAISLELEGEKSAVRPLFELADTAAFAILVVPILAVPLYLKVFWTLHRVCSYECFICHPAPRKGSSARRRHRRLPFF